MELYPSDEQVIDTLEAEIKKQQKEINELVIALEALLFMDTPDYIEHARELITKHKEKN